MPVPEAGTGMCLAPTKSKNRVAGEIRRPHRWHRGQRQGFVMHPTDSQNFQRMARVIRYIDEHFGQQPSLAELAGVAGLSPAHFSREFRRWAGLAPTQYVRLLSLRAAKKSLEADTSIIAAAWEAGLSGGGRLHDLFVTFEAMTPGEYRAGGEGLLLRYGLAETPFGTALLATTARGLAVLEFIDDTGRRAEAGLAQRWPAARLLRDDEHAAAVARQVFVARSGKLPLHLRGTNFQVRVWEALLDLGGRGPLSYGRLAAAIGKPRAARAVGQAVGANPVAWMIPCHRVLRAGGGLGGYRWGIDRKRAMLAWELSQANA
jgi:AraC family transcriptional regulator of adaptative response/methylated-DNA-[protein]-cysteine methyltransferase